MKRNKATTLIAAVLLGTGLIAAQAGEKKAEESKKQTTCPVMGGKINKAQFVDVKGYRIYVCCPGCKAKIKADPGKYIEKMKKDGVEPEKAPKKKMDHTDHSGHSH